MPLSQEQRIIAVLRRVGDRGITAADFLLPDVIDGGAPMIRLASRISALRQQGWQIDMRREKRMGVYTLRVDRKGDQ